jgi:hypothetical protein
MGMDMAMEKKLKDMATTVLAVTIRHMVMKEGMDMVMRTVLMVTTTAAAAVTILHTLARRRNMPMTTVYRQLEFKETKRFTKRSWTALSVG